MVSRPSNIKPRLPNIHGNRGLVKLSRNVSPTFIRTARVLMDIIDAHSQRPIPLKVIVIGCAEGVEVYSMAAVLHMNGMLKRVSLTGVDPNIGLAVEAADGVYNVVKHGGADRLRGLIPDECRNLFSVSQVEGKGRCLVVNARFRKAGRFAFFCTDPSSPEFAKKIRREFGWQDIAIMGVSHAESVRGQWGSIVPLLLKGGRLIARGGVQHPGLGLQIKSQNVSVYKVI
jgi:hypothetical protein